MATLVLDPKREARIKAGHPWVLRRDVRRVKGQLRDGDVAAVSDQAGRRIGMAIVNTQSRILARIYTLTEQTATPEEWLAHLAALRTQVESVPLEDARKAHRKWWSDFWQRSWFFAAGDDDRRADQLEPARMVVEVFLDLVDELRR